MRTVRIAKIIALGYLIVFLVACSSDMNFRLPNDYHILKVNSKRVVLCEEDPEIKGQYHSIIRDYHITKFCVIDQYVAMGGYQVDNGKLDDNYKEKLFVYYLFNTESEEVSEEFFSEEELHTKLDTLGIDRNFNWTQTGSAAQETD